MRIQFIKGHGSGNDFPTIDARGLELADAEWSIVARALSDRRGCVGGDGILLLTETGGKGNFGFRMFNVDGSEAETCLNGLRLVARLGFATFHLAEAEVDLATSHATVALDDPLAPGVVTIRETAGPATLDVAAWPMASDTAEIVDRPIPALSGTLAFTAVAMPNPHLVTFVDRIDEVELIRVGGMCEAAPDWLPNRANVSFIEVRDATTIYVRTFERGVGLTDSCGSAMAASTYAGGLTGRLAFGAQTNVRNRGGLVRIRAGADGMVTLAGNATFEWEGSVEIDPARGVAEDLIVTRRYPEEIAAWDAVLAALDRPG